MLSQAKKATFYMRLFGLTKIPLVFFIRPAVVSLSETDISIRVPFKRRNKNHLGSMYFGALNIGAELAAGLLAYQKIKESNQNIALIFKDFSAEFLKRAEGDTFFKCTGGKMIADLVTQASQSQERVQNTIKVTATVPSKFGAEPVAQFSLTLSLKKY